MLTVSRLKLGLVFVLASGCSRATPTPPSTVAAATPTPAATATATSTATATLASAPTPRHATALRVDRLVIARGVESREPLGADTVFAADEKRLFAFVEVDNPEHAPGDLRVQFIAPGGETQPPIELSVGDSPRWRTWAFTRHARAPGTWKAVVRDERGQVLASTEFDVRG
jgi:hypothetical protein